MKKRVATPYSLNQKLQQLRSSFLELLLLTLLLGLALGLFGAAAYELAFLFFQKSLVSIGVLLLLALALIAIALWAWFKVSKFHCIKTEPLRMEVTIPYMLTGKDRVEVVKQHPYRPVYMPAKFARKDFHSVFPPGGDENRKLAFAWQELRMKGEPVQSLLADLHKQLVEALLIDVIHRHAEDALSGKSRYKWWQIPLQTHEWRFTDLDPLLQQNIFLRWRDEKQKEKLKKKEGKNKVDEKEKLWHLLLPQDVTLFVDEEENARVYRLTHVRENQSLVIRLYDRPWVADVASQPGKVLGEGVLHRILKDKDNKGIFYVLGSRVQAQATFCYELLLPPERDALQQWATDLLSYLEEALDFRYFSQNRPLRMIPDIAWKVGDMELGDSLTKKLDGIHRELRNLEKKLEGTQKQIGGLRAQIKAGQEAKEDGA